MRTRMVTALLAIVALGAVAWFGWRWEVQAVDLVIVNASGMPAQLSWQPGLFAGEETINIGGCESKSMQLRAGARWRFVHDRLEMNSSIVDVPPITREVAVEIWLAADGSSRYVPAYAVEEAIDAPHPQGCATTP